MNNFSVSRPPQLGTRNVAVIGAGAAGLAAARELKREGHNVVVFERNSEVGGTWIYEETTESDQSGRNPHRTVVHSSLYRSLRTNIPREIMGFKDYPFMPKPGSSDARRYPRHEEVLAYLRDFTRQFDVVESLRLDTEVVRVERRPEDDCWKVKSRRNGCDAHREELYDAIVVCNGHFTEPRLAHVPGVKSWPGKEMHSHNYRTPDPFNNKVVVVIGNSSSSTDISRELAGVAKEVHVASHSFPDDKFELLLGYANVWLNSMIDRANEDGTVFFRNHRSVNADIILHCTGYKYHFPFMEGNRFVEVDDNRVWPLYKHIFPPAYAPWLSFVGIPSKTAPFFLFEFQSKWIAGVLSGRIPLPTEEEMMNEVVEFCQKLDASKVPKRHTHCLDDSRFEYIDWLAAQCGCSGTEKWRELMYNECANGRRIGPDTFRDDWEDDDLVAQAYHDFEEYS